MFSIILNIVGSLMHFYVAQRLHAIPFVRTRVAPKLWWSGVMLVWLVYLLGVQLGDDALDWRWLPAQFALTWLGIAFLMTLCLLVADLATGFGLWWRAHAPRLRALAAVAGIMLSALAMFQALRAPAVVEYEVALKALPPELDGTVLVVLSDLHLGMQRRTGWMQARVGQINGLRPNAVLFVGDLVDDKPLGDKRLAEVLHGLKAPLGVWAVTGNHEYYGDAETTMAEFAAGGVHWLRDEQVELAPGLVLAGIDDIGRAMHARADLTTGLAHALPQARAQRGATVLAAHIPAGPVIDAAARQGVDLMLSGHTHGGQIWPFTYLVAQRFPRYAGRHDIGDMTLIVSRGAGSRGPRMRLWQPGEIVKITLRAAR